MRQTNTETKIKIVAFVLLISLCLLIYWMNPLFFARFWQIATSGNMEDTIQYIASFGVWAMLFSFLLDVLINALGFLPSIFISTANGVLFGVVPGVLISWLAETVGVVLSFFLMRGILRSSAERLIAKSDYLQRLDEFSGRNGFKMMLIARTLPYFPSGIITAVGALSSISARDYIVANLIGKFPSTALEVIIGHDIVNYEKNLGRLSAVVVAATLVYFSLWWFGRRKKRA